MLLLARPWDTNYPPEYRTYKECGVPTEFFPFPGGEARVHRFAARYRFAKEFQAVTFETFSSSISAAYSALCKYQFTYGAFEALRRALGIADDMRDIDLGQYPVKDWDAALRAIETHPRLFNFMRWHLRAGLRAECERFLANKHYNVLLIATAVRNSFDHGHLTPSANKAEPSDTRQVCRVLGSALVAIMDREFSTRVTTTLDDLFEKGYE